ncbi:MAG: phage head closure protein [Candidatus Thorarchaeota archaeon]
MRRFDGSRLLNPGLCRERITIYYPVEGAQDSYGIPAETPTVFQQCNARVRRLQGREWQAIQQRWAKATWMIELPYLAGIRPKMTVAWEGHTLNILHVGDRQGWRQVIEVICEEIT